MIKGKSPGEIHKTFNIQNDFTPEEEDLTSVISIYKYLLILYRL